jgi:hypothetical protein
MKKGEATENLPLHFLMNAVLGAKELAFGILELRPCSFLTIFFTFFHARISCQQALFFERVS